MPSTSWRFSGSIPKFSFWTVGLIGRIKEDFLSSVLILSILLQAFSSTFVYLNYQLNKEYISKTLCVNKDKPQMHCNGKCHLKKQLDKEERTENIPSGTKEKNELSIINQYYSLKLINTPLVQELKSFYCRADYSHPFFSVFHPPQL